MYLSMMTMMMITALFRRGVGQSVALGLSGLSGLSGLCLGSAGPWTLLVSSKVGNFGPTTKLEPTRATDLPFVLALWYIYIHK